MLALSCVAYPCDGFMSLGVFTADEIQLHDPFLCY